MHSCRFRVHVTDSGNDVMWSQGQEESSGVLIDGTLLDNKIRGVHHTRFHQVDIPGFQLRLRRKLLVLLPTTISLEVTRGCTVD